MSLSAEQRDRVEEQVRLMIAELRVKPTQAKEDRLGLAVATLPPEEADRRRGARRQQPRRRLRATS